MAEEQKLKVGDWAVYSALPGAVAMLIVRIEGDTAWRQARECVIDSPLNQLTRATDAQREVGQALRWPIEYRRPIVGGRV